MKRWTVLRAVLAKCLIEMKRYAFNSVSGLITMYIVFLLLFMGAKFVGAEAFQTGGSLEGMVVSYLVWMMAIQAYQDLAYEISSEAEMGTLEQLYLCPLGFAWVNGSFLIARFLVNLIFTGVVLTLMMLTTGRWLNLDVISMLPLIVITVAAAYGLGFLLAGLAVVFKRIQNSFQILTFGLVAFVIAPISRYPWVKLLPLSLGNDLMRRVMVDGTRLWQLPGAEVALATAVGLAYFLAGLLAFSQCTRVARDRGMLGHY